MMSAAGSASKRAIPDPDCLIRNLNNLPVGSNGIGERHLILVRRRIG